MKNREMNGDRRPLTIAIQGRGSSTVKDMEIIAGLLEKDTGILLKPLMEDDVYRRLGLLKRGEVDLFYEYDWSAAWIESKVPEMASRLRGPFQLRMVASAHFGAIGFMVRADSPIRTIYDIKPDTRVAVVNKIGDLAAALLACLGKHRGPLAASPTESEWQVKLAPFATMEESLRAVGDGRADFTIAAPENPVVKELAATKQGIRFLALPAADDPAGAARFRKVLPYGQLKPAPERGVKEIWGVTSYIGSACLWCRDSFDADVAYTLTRWFDKNYERYRDKGNKLDTYTREALRQSLDTAIAPVHEGTMRYFKEIGQWSPSDEIRQAYNAKLMDWYCQAWAGALARAEGQGIEASAGNPRWLRMWADYKKEIGIPGYRALTDDEVRDALRHISKQ